MAMRTRGSKAKPGLGLFAALPDEVLALICDKCGVRGWATMRATSKRLGAAVQPAIDEAQDSEARFDKLKQDLRPGESMLVLYNYAVTQTFAIAQSTAAQFGSLHSAAILLRHDDRYTDSEGRARYRLYTWGRGFYGQLGEHRTEVEPLEESVLHPRSVRLGQSCYDDDHDEEIMPVSVTCGSNHTAVITRRGDLISWGMGTSGQTGHGPVVGDTHTPKKVQLWEDGSPVRVVACSCGGQETMSIDERGMLWACGRNVSGQLGFAATESVFSMTRISPSFTGAWAREARPTAVSIQAGLHHSAILMSNGALFTCGKPANGRLGLVLPFAHPHDVNLENVPSVTLPRIVDTFAPTRQLPAMDYATYVTCGDAHTMAITLGGKLLCWGDNFYGQLGTGDCYDRHQPAQVWLADESHPTEGLERAIFVAAGARHSCALVSYSGRIILRSTGGNAYGQLGHGDTTNRNRFEEVRYFRSARVHVTTAICGAWHTGAVDEEGSLYTWGRGDRGQLGTGEEYGRYLPRKMHGFTVANPTHTLHRNQRPAPKLLKRSLADLADVDTITPTPHPNAFKVPRACASKPVRGPLDAHFRRIAPLKRAQSLPSNLDHLARTSGRNGVARSGAAAGAPARTPAFTNLDPRPFLASATGPSSEDYQVLNGAANEPSSTGNVSAVAPASTAHSLTPRLDSLAVTAAATCAGQICTHMDTAMALRSCGPRCTDSAHGPAADTDMVDADAATLDTSLQSSMLQQSQAAGKPSASGTTHAPSNLQVGLSKLSRRASTPAQLSSQPGKDFSFTSPPAAHDDFGSAAMRAPKYQPAQAPTPGFGFVASAQHGIDSHGDTDMIDAGAAGVHARTGPSSGDAKQRAKRRGLSTRSVNAPSAQSNMAGVLRGHDTAAGAGSSKMAARSHGYSLRNSSTARQ